MVKSTLKVSNANNFFVEKYYTEGQICFFLFPDYSIPLMSHRGGSVQVFYAT